MTLKATTTSKRLVLPLRVAQWKHLFVKSLVMRAAEGSVVVDKIKNSDSASFGYNAATGEYGDMLEMGILDPAKVTRSALQAAASIAGLMITTEAMIAELPEDKPAAPAAGGAPDMGGMM